MPYFLRRRQLSPAAACRTLSGGGMPDEALASWNEEGPDR
jgi:hypothetical protein